MCIIMPPAPPPTTYPPIPKPPAPAPVTPPLPPSSGDPPSPPAPPPSVVFDLQNSQVIGGTYPSFQKVLADNGVLLTYTNSGSPSCILRIVVQNNNSIPVDAQLTITPLVTNAFTLTPQSPILVSVGANNYTTVNVTVLANTEGTVPVVLTIGTTSITLPIAFYNLSP